MRKTLVAAVAALIAAFIVAPAASAIDRVNTGELRRGVTVDGILEHERALQDIAIANDGNRAATTDGYDASVDYVATKLRRAGYRVTLDPFSFPTWTKNGPSTLTRTSPAPAVTYGEDTDYIVSQFSAAGDVTGPIFVARRTELPDPSGPGLSQSGCDIADFAGNPGWGDRAHTAWHVPVHPEVPKRAGRRRGCRTDLQRRLRGPDGPAVHRGSDRRRRFRAR